MASHGSTLRSGIGSSWRVLKYPRWIAAYVLFHGLCSPVWAQQTITYTNGENNAPNIGINGSTNPLTLSLSSGSATQSGAISDSGTMGSVLVNAGTGTLTLTGSNSYSGGTTISNGTLALGSGGSLYSAGAVAVNGTFDISQAGNQNIGDLSGSGTIALGSNGLIITEADNTTFSGSVVGGTGGGLAKYGAGTLTLTGSNSYMGGGGGSYTGTSVSFGTLVLQGGSINHPNGMLFVGADSGDNGTFIVSNGGQITTSGAFGTNIGFNTGSTGTVTVTGASSTLNSSSSSANIYVGRWGTGTLNVEDGGSVISANQVYLGLNSGSNGTATVTGVNANHTASTLSVATDLFVGNSGTGSLTISNGGIVTDGGFGRVGANSGSIGSMTVTGTGSSWSTVGDVHVGDAGVGTLTISSGGTVLDGGGTGTLTLASQSGSAGILNIGNGGTAGTLQAASVFGGSGAGQINFGETDASYNFAPALTGSLSIVQSGTGTTVLSQTNSFNGSITVDFGTLSVSGANAVINYTANSAFIGLNAGDNGTMLISGGGKIFEYNTYIGTLAGSTGDITVTGAASTWSNSNNMYVGDFGTGTLNIQNGGQVTNSNLAYLAYQTGSTGTVTITGINSNGTASKWTSSTNISVGYQGSGTLMISSGGQVTSATGYIGDGAGSVGSVTVNGVNANGTASLWSSSNDMVDGNNGAGTVVIEDGGIITDVHGHIGDFTGSSGTMTVTGVNANGTASTWSTIQDATVGAYGTGTLNVEDGAKVTDGTGNIGYFSGSSGTATVTGVSANNNTASTWNTTGALSVGLSGTGTLTVSNGGQVTDYGGFVGYNSGSTGTATVTGVNANGTASKWSNTTSFVVGAFTNGQLSILDGGQVSSATGEIGDAAGSTGVVTVSGVNANSSTASAWNLTGGTLLVSDSGTGTLTVSNGGQVNDYHGSIGDEAGSNGTATVTGLNANGTVSTWSNGSEFYVGNNGSGTLNIENGGLLTDINGYVGTEAGSMGAATVTGASSTTPSSWINSGTLIVGNLGTGSLTVENGGVVSSISVILANTNSAGGTVNLETNGVLETGSVLNDFGAGGAALNFNGGILRATASNTAFITNFSTNEVTLQSGGGTIDNNGYSITVNSPMGGAGALTLTGSNVTTYTGGNSYSGGTTINQGTTLALASGGSLYSAGAVTANGKFDISQSTNQSIGDLSGSGTVALGSYGLTVNEQALTDNTTFSGSIVDGGIGHGTGGQLTKSGLGTLNLTGSNSYTGSTTINLGTLNVSGTGATINSPSAVLDVGLNNGDNGSLLISNGGVVTNSQADIGSAFGSKGTATVTGTGSAWNAGNQNFNIGNSGSGILNIQNGGTVTDNLGVIANAPSSSGTVTVTGVNSTWNNARLFVGNAGTGMLTISSGGVVTSTLIAYITDEPGETTEIGTLNLDSNGVLLAPQIVNGSNSTNAAFNINGGILRATGSSSDFISNFSSNQVMIQSGGATIDSNGNNISVLSNLNGTGGGGLTKVGTGMLTLAGTNSYTGTTTINGGTVSVGSILAPLSAQPLGESSSIVFGGTSPTTPTTLQYTGGTQTISQNMTVNSGAYGEIYNLGTGVVTLTGSLNISGATFGLTGTNFIVSSAITGSSPNSNLDIGSAAYPGNTTVGLRSANSYNGATVISQGSTLLLGKQNALPSTTAVTIGAASDGSEINTLDLLGNNETVAGLFSGGGTNQVISSNGLVPLNGTLGIPAIGTTFSGNLATLTVNYSLTGTDIYGGFLGEGDSNNTRNANKLELIKSGTGILALSNANTYTGSTEVQSGTLMIQNGTNGSATGSGSLTVDPGATFGGAGTVQDTDLQHGININGTLIVGSGTDYTSKTYLVAPASVSFQNATLQFNLFQTPGSINGQNNTLYLPSSLVGSTLEPTPVYFNNTTLQLNLSNGSSPIGYNTIYNLISTTTLNASNAANYGLTLGADGKQITGGLQISSTSNLGPDYSGAYIYFSGDNIELQGQLSNFAINPPPTPSSGQGSILVNLSPAGVGGWQLQGEQLWRPAGSTVTGLTNGSYTIEFEPVPGYIQPSPQSVTISGASSSLTISGTYYPVATGANGILQIVLNTSSLTNHLYGTNPSTGWRISGQTAWQSSGASVSLAPGTYLIEGEPVSLPVDTNGNNQYVTTPVSYVTVTSGQTESATLVYPAPTSSVGNAPQVLPFGTQTSTLPYAFVGQIRTNAGVATGFVVEEHVVATAAHVIFDDSSLAYATEIQWIFQRSAGTYDPPPQIPQGYYMSSSYSELRTQALQQGGTAGVENTASENLDVAALYFLGNADGTTTGTGSYSGYLASDSVPNQFLSPTGTKLMATLVGYPVDGISSSQQGQAFYTTPVRATFSLVTGTDTTGTGGIDAEPNTTGLAYQVYTSTSLSSVGGNSGGPLCLLYDAGDGNGPQYRPAAIYLGGNSSQSNFKAIDGLAVDLFTRAQTSANAGVQHLGGGITSVNSPLQGKLVTSTAVQVTVLPLSASSSAASNWNLTSGTDTFSGKYPFPSGFEYQTTSTGNATVYFGSVQGFLTPPPLPVTLTAGQVTEVTATYEGITANPSDAATAANSPATFSVSVSGTPTAYQWMKNGTAISGATSAIYALSSPTLADAGAYSVKVTWGSDGPLTSNAANLTVVPLTQFITFPVIGNQVYGTAPITLAAFSSSGLPINYTVTSGPATVSGTQLNQLTFTGTGSVTVQANQPGDGVTYSAALSVPQTLLITPPTQITFAQWLTQYVVNGGATGTPLHDGVQNEIKYLCDINPTTAMSATDHAALPAVGIDTTSTPGTQYLELTYRQYSGLTGTSVHFQTSTNLINWTTVAPDLTKQTPLANGDSTIELGVKINPAVKAEYIRLNLTTP